jgi:hypothetical protein
MGGRGLGMGKRNNRTIFWIIALLIIYAFGACSRDSGSINNNSRENASTKNIDIEQFQTAMKDKGYKFKILDVEQDFLPTTRKRMMMEDKEAIDLYLFSSNKKMESEANNIDNNGFGYHSGSIYINVSWISHPHFYKNGKMIVQYVGINESIISDLRDIFGEQFIGD